MHLIVLKLLFSLICVYVKLNNVSAQDVLLYDDCQEGRCMPLEKCDVLRKQFTSNLTYVTRYLCAWNQLKVCCPIMPSTAMTTDASLTCRTSSGNLKKGSCVPLVSCEDIKNKLKNGTITRDDLVTLRCKGSDILNKVSVCCEHQQDIMIDSKYIDNETMSCGTEIFDGNETLGGNDTSIYQYPWLAILKYSDEKRFCGGSLINNRYVLTAAHCVTPTSVILGEHDIASEDDCEQVSEYNKECNTNGTVQIDVEICFVHPGYKKTSKIDFYRIITVPHDIALCKLARTVDFNAFIAPICLPTTDITILPTTTLKFFAAGWGAVNVISIQSNIKQHVELPFVNYGRCAKTYSDTIWEYQICAGGEAGKDTCKGDSGGPLMYNRNGIQEIIGVTSYGLLHCGISGKPAVYTKVYKYLPWINKHINAV